MCSLSVICHHGIKGQKWGVRRYQNSDGSLTEEGKKRQTYRNNIIRNRPHTDAVNDIVRSLSKEDIDKLTDHLDGDWINKENEYDILPNIANTFIEKHNNIPASFLEIWTNGGRKGCVAIATRSGQEFRGKGYASKNVEKAIKWVDHYVNKSIDELRWEVRADNIASQKLAEKHGFEYYESAIDDEGQEWKRYYRETKRR